MNQEIKAEWVEALRSGKYKQGTEVLHNSNTDTYCCLGVLCDLAVKEGVIPTPNRGLEGYYLYGDHRSKSISALPLTVQEWAELKESNPTPPGARDSLAKANDNGMPFNEIADIIEGYL